MPFKFQLLNKPKIMYINTKNSFNTIYQTEDAPLSHLLSLPGAMLKSLAHKHPNTGDST